MGKTQIGKVMLSIGVVVLGVTFVVAASQNETPEEKKIAAYKETETYKNNLELDRRSSMNAPVKQTPTSKPEKQWQPPAKMEWWNVCKLWGTQHKKKRALATKVASYLAENEIINSNDLMGIGGKIPAPGMTACGAIAVWGIPNNINITETAYGRHQQMVYERGYVYTVAERGDGNGVIRTVQH